VRSECLSLFSNGCECWRFRCHFLNDTTGNLSSYLCYLTHCRSMSLLRCRMLSSPYPRHDFVSAFWYLTVHSFYPSSLLIKHSASHNTDLFFALVLLVIMADAMRCNLQCYPSHFSPVSQSKVFFLKQRHQGEDSMKKRRFLSILITWMSAE